MNASNPYIIENGVLVKYTGPDGEAVIPEGVAVIDWWAFHGKEITALTLPASLQKAPTGALDLKKLTSVTVAADNPNFKSVDGVLYDAAMQKLLLFPAAHGTEYHIPEGVTEIGWKALYGSGITVLSLPASLQKVSSGTFILENLTHITVAEGNPCFKSLDGVLYSADLKKLICCPAARGTEIRVPAGVVAVSLESLSAWFAAEYQIHMGADVQSLEQLADGSHITIHAPAGSYAERFARRCNCKYVEEGEPVSADDSDERKERSLKEWRLIFTISTRSKGLNISKYSRGSKVVYLPDVMGKAEVATVDKEAFPPDVTVLCSKKLFNKLGPDNRHATIRSYLLNRELFTQEEQEYLLAYLKKYRAIYLEKYIKGEDYPALEAILKAMPKVKTLMDECLEITQQLGREDVNFFLLQYNQSK